MKIKLMEDMLTEQEVEAVVQCLRSGQYTQGALVDDFEKKFAQWNGSKYAVMVNSGSSANLLMIALLKQKYGLRDGDEVLVPMVTWPTTIYPVIQHRFHPVFCDLDASFNLEVNSLRRMISERTKAIFVVHLLGQPAEMEEIAQICRENNLVLIEDCCESLGAKYQGKKVGNFGVMGSFSFYFGHHLTTIEGGMIVTDDFITYDLLKSVRSHGWVRDSARTQLHPEFEDQKFLFDLEGYNLRSTNLNAAIGLVQLKKVDDWIQKRVDNHHYFSKKIAGLGLRSQLVNLQASSSFCFALIFNSKEEKDYVLKNLAHKQIEARPIVTGNLLRQPVFRHRGFRADQSFMADLIHDNGLYLPNNQFMTPEKIDYMLDSVIELREEFSKMTHSNLNKNNNNNRSGADWF